MSSPVVAVLDRLTPAAEDGWHVLFDLAETDGANWVLVGGQMVYLLAVENGVPPVRATDDVDVALDVRAKPGATEWLAGWLVDRGFELESVSADGIGHRFVRPADPGPGRVVIDILAPDGVGARTEVFTRRPARTVRAPGTTQAFARSSLITVSVTGDTGRGIRTGRVRRPNVLGALITKAAATTIAVRQNPDRDFEDAALLLSLIDDPIAARADCGRADVKKLDRLRLLADTRHPAWLLLGGQAAERGRDALGFLIG
jgi:hypothetical protein